VTLVALIGLAVGAALPKTGGVWPQQHGGGCGRTEMGCAGTGCRRIRLSQLDSRFRLPRNTPITTNTTISLTRKQRGRNAHHPNGTALHNSEYELRARVFTCVALRQSHWL